MNSGQQPRWLAPSPTYGTHPAGPETLLLIHPFCSQCIYCDQFKYFLYSQESGHLILKSEGNPEQTGRGIKGRKTNIAIPLFPTCPSQKLAQLRHPIWGAEHSVVSQGQASGGDRSSHPVAQSLAGDELEFSIRLWDCGGTDMRGRTRWSSC